MRNELRKQKYIDSADGTTPRHRMHGTAVIRMLLLVPITLVVLLALVFAFYEGRKAYWDYRIMKLCAEDGGTTVYEKAAIPDKYVDKNGVIKIPPKSNGADGRLHFQAKDTDPFYYEWINEPITTGRLSVEKHTFNIVRASDQRILGRMIVYSRSGGDFPTYAHPSSISCPDPRERKDPLELVFVKEDPSRREKND